MGGGVGGKRRDSVLCQKSCLKWTKFSSKLISFLSHYIPTSDGCIMHSSHLTHTLQCWHHALLHTDEQTESQKAALVKVS